MTHLSLVILGTLILILLASVSVFEILARRATSGQRTAAMRQWAAAHGARWQDRLEPTELDAGLAMLRGFHPNGGPVIIGDGWTFAELKTDAPHTAKGKPPRWRLAGWRLDASWPPTGLRPVAHAVSLLDLFDIGSFPSLSGDERFIVFGSQAIAAHAMADSAVAAALPPDIGLLVHGQALVLDFSGREFNGREFERLLELAGQLAAELAKKAASWQIRV